jgi:hypothetical protein
MLAIASRPSESAPGEISYLAAPIPMKAEAQANTVTSAAAAATTGARVGGGAGWATGTLLAKARY